MNDRKWKKILDVNEAKWECRAKKFEACLTNLEDTKTELKGRVLRLEWEKKTKQDGINKCPWPIKKWAITKSSNRDESIATRVVMMLGLNLMCMILTNTKLHTSNSIETNAIQSVSIIFYCVAIIVSCCPFKRRRPDC